MEKRLGRCVKLASVSLLVHLFFLTGALMPAAPVAAASFNLFYDNDGDGVLGTIVGTGTVSYDGPATAGSFSLASLSGFAFNANVLGQSFTTAHLRTNLSLSGISVFSLGGGAFGLVFTGNGGTAAGGSLDLVIPSVQTLTHEFTLGIANRIGCCGGNGTVNQYLRVGGFGDYVATTIPEPDTAVLLGIGLLGLAWMQRAFRPVASTAPAWRDHAPMNIRN